MAEYTVVASDGKTYRVQGPEGLPEEIVRMDVDRRLRKQLRDAAPPPEPAPIERTMAGRAGELFRGIPRGAVGLLETAAVGASALLPEELETSARERIASIGEAAAAPFQPKPGYEDSISAKFGEAAGSFVPFLAAGPFGLAGRVAATGLGAGAGAGTARERAEQGDATPEERAMATGLGSLVGLSEVVVPFRILGNAIGNVPAQGVLNRLRRAAQAGGEEGLLEAAAEVAQNLIERGVYNPEQGAFVGTGESFGYGAGVGGLAQGLFDLFAPGRDRGVSAPPAAEQGAETETTPVAPAEPLRTVSVPLIMTGGGANGVMRVVQEPSGRLFGELVDPAGNVRMRQPIQAASPNAFLDEMAKLEKAGQPVNMETFVAAINRASTITRPPEQQGVFSAEEAPVSGAVPPPSLTGEEIDTQTRTAEITKLRESLDRLTQQKSAVEYLRSRLNVGTPEQRASVKKQLDAVEKTKVLSPVEAEAATRRLLALEAGAPLGTRRELEAAGQTDLVTQLQRLQAEDSALAAEQRQRGDFFPGELEAATSDERTVARAMARSQAREDESIAAMDADVEAVESQDQEQLDMLGFDEVVDTTPPTPPPPSAAVTPTPTPPPPPPPPPPPTTPMQFGSTDVANAAARQIATELGVDISDADLAALVKPTIRFALPSREPAIRKALQKMVPAAAAATPAATTPTREKTTYDETPTERRQRKKEEKAQGTLREQVDNTNRAIEADINRFSPLEINEAIEEIAVADGTFTDRPSKGKEKEWLRGLKETNPNRTVEIINTVRRSEARGQDPIELPGRFSVQPKREEAASIPANVRLMDRVRRGDSTANILSGISQDTDVPQPLRNLARSMLRVAPNITVPVIERKYKEPDVVGQYVHPQQGSEAIYLDPRAESAAQTFLHEFVHPMTVNAIARGTPEGKRVVQLFEQYKEQHPESTAYGFENAYEFVAEGITNQNFQKTLKRQNWWGRFTDAIRRIIGLPASQSGTVEELIDLTKRMGAAENISRTQKAAEQVIFNDTPQNNIRFLRVQGAQLNEASVPVKAPKFKRAVAAMFDKGQESVTRAMVWGLGLDQINDYVQSYVKKKGPAYEPFVASFDRFTKIAGKLEGEMRQFIDSITAQVARMGDWRNSHPDLYDDMNTLVYGGTLGKVDLTKPKSTYAKNPEQLKEYERLEKVLKKLEPSGGAAIYRQMRAIYNRVFNGITQQVYDGVYSATQDADLATTIKNKFTEQMKLRGLEGYAALTRNNGKYRIKFFLPNSDTPYFETFENSADWEARQRQLVTEDGVNQNDMTPFLHGDRSVFDGIVPTSFMGDLVQTLKNKNASADLLAAVMELGISVSPAQVVMERLVARKETPGYTLDAFAAFQESVVGLQRKLINMKYSAQMSKEVRDMEATRSNVKTDPTVVLLIDEVRNRAAYAANPNQNAISNILTTGTYGWTLGLNVSSAVVDMLSLIVTGGYLSGRFKSRRKAHAALVKAGSDILGMGTTADVETMVTQGLDGAALQEAMKTAGINERDVTRRRVAPSMLNIDFNNPEQAKKYGYLKSLVDKVRDQGHSERFSDLEERAEFGESNILSKISARMGFMMSTSERYKRETGLKAFYDLALAEVAPNADPTKATKEQMEKAADEAMNMSRLLNGGSTSVTGPGFQRDNFWRVAFMYRSFAFRQMYVQVKTLYDATMNDEKAVKDAARKFGSTVLLTSGALVGIQGMPFFGPVALLLNVLAAPFVDDEEEEKFVQNMLRSNLDPLIYEGLPNALLNMNVSERASLTDLLVRDTNLPEDASFAETMAAHFGGPAVGSMERFWRGKGLIEQGEIQRGLESMIPVTLSNVLKSIRFATDGAAETLRGDEVTEISPIAVVSQFLGFTPADYARTMEFKSIQAGVDRRIAERKANLYAAAYAAYRFGDSAGLAQVMQKMIEFNQQHPEEAIKNKDFKQSLQARARNSEKMLGGTLPRESRRAEWQEAADDWGVEFPN